MDVDIHLVRDNLRDVKQHAHTIDTLNADGGIEEQLLVHIPFGIKDAIAETGLQFGCHRTGTLMDFYLVTAVDESQHVVARDWVAAMLELVLPNGFFGNENGLFAVELLWNHKQLLLLFSAFLFLLVTIQERHELTPAFLVGILTLQFVKVFLAQENSFVAQCLIELVAIT